VVPTTWLSVLFYVLLIAPGLLYDLLAARRRPLANESAFHEISRTVLAGLIFSMCSFVVLEGIDRFVRGWLPDTRELIFHSSLYLPSHYTIVVRALVAEGLLAFAFVWLFHFIQLRFTRARLRPVSTWTRVLRQELEPGFVPYVEVRLTNGMTYVGRVGHFTHDLDIADRELILVPLLFVQQPGGRLTDMPSEWQRIVISGEAIQSMAVQYRKDHTGSRQSAVVGVSRIASGIKAKLIKHQKNRAVEPVPDDFPGESVA
jgi:Family of unknown function (DUF6338)